MGVRVPAFLSFSCIQSLIVDINMAERLETKGFGSVQESRGGNHQTEHLEWGFMLDPRGQLKLSANSRMLLMGPMTRIMEGE